MYIRITEETTDRLEAMKVKRAMIDQSPFFAVYMLMIVVKSPARALSRVGLVVDNR